MRVQFDLRPAEYLEIERKRSSFNPIRLLAILLMFAFFATCIGYLAMAFLETQALQSEIEDREAMIADLEADQNNLTAEINRLKNRETQFIKTLRIMQSEPPTLEVLNALETHMDAGMGLKSVRFTPANAGNRGRNTSSNETIAYNATVEASAVTEDQIVSLTNGLSGSGVFSGVTMPSSERRQDRDDTTERVHFSLLLNARPLGQIQVSTPMMMSGDVGEGQQ